MNELESQLKQMIIDKYGSLKKFSDTINMPWTTLDSILKRGIANSNITNVLKITRELGLDTEKLVDGKLVQNISSPTTLAAHFDGDEYTKEELAEIRQFADFVKSKRKDLYPEVNAAHGRTDIEVTDEMRQHDDDIMNDDSEWE